MQSFNYAFEGKNTNKPLYMALIFLTSKIY